MGHGVPSCEEFTGSRKDNKSAYFLAVVPENTVFGQVKAVRAILVKEKVEEST